MLALDRELGDGLTRLRVQNDQLTQLKTQSNIPNAALDALTIELNARYTQVRELVMEKSNLSSRTGEFSPRVKNKISLGNSDFSDLRNDRCA
jgi:hypothetical protein